LEKKDVEEEKVTQSTRATRALRSNKIIQESESSESDVGEGSDEDEEVSDLDEEDPSILNLITNMNLDALNDEKDEFNLEEYLKFKEQLGEDIPREEASDGGSAGEEYDDSEDEDTY